MFSDIGSFYEQEIVGDFINIELQSDLCIIFLLARPDIQ